MNKYKVLIITNDVNGYCTILILTKKVGEQHVRQRITKNYPKRHQKH